MRTGKARAKRHGTSGEWVIAVRVDGAEKWKNVKLNHIEDGLCRSILQGVTEDTTDEQAIEQAVEVDFENNNGLITRVRRRGEPWPVTVERRSDAQSDRVRADRDSGSEMPVRNQFLNPYAFVRAKERTEAWRGGVLGDREPYGHGRGEPDTWTGRIVVHLEATTPLLLLDSPRSTGKATEDNEVHRTFGVRVDPDGAPILPITSLKGALRAAYEAVTSSRFGVWYWDHPLEYRAGRRGRQSWPVSPKQLAKDAGLLPATSLGELSPADRVFGWVSHSGKEAHRGQLRIEAIRCVDEKPQEAVEQFEKCPIPLAILSTPKPTQGRFYASPARDGVPHEHHTDKSNLYAKNGGLRGRKFYWHHAGTPESSEYWKKASSTRQNGGWFAEFRHPTAERTDQNRSINAWVKPGTGFQAQIDVSNLTAEELGGLLWLVGSSGPGMLRVGFGKPLGFGSVRVCIDAERTQLWVCGGGGSEGVTIGPDLVMSRYRALHVDPGSKGTTEEIIDCLVSSFIKAADEHALEQFAAIMAGNTSFRVHYPRRANGYPPPPPNPEGENFRWFVENERQLKFSLPDAADSDPSLEYL